MQSSGSQGLIQKEASEPACPSFMPVQVSFPLYECAPSCTLKLLIASQKLQVDHLKHSHLPVCVGAQVSIPQPLCTQLLALAAADAVLSFAWEHSLRRLLPTKRPFTKGWLALQARQDALLQGKQKAA